MKGANRFPPSTWIRIIISIQVQDKIVVLGGVKVDKTSVMLSLNNDIPEVEDLTVIFYEFILAPDPPHNIIQKLTNLNQPVYKHISVQTLPYLTAHLGVSCTLCTVVQTNRRTSRVGVVGSIAIRFGIKSHQALVKFDISASDICMCDQNKIWPGLFNLEMYFLLECCSVVRCIQPYRAMPCSYSKNSIYTVFGKVITILISFVIFYVDRKFFLKTSISFYQLQQFHRYIGLYINQRYAAKNHNCHLLSLVSIITLFSGIH